MSSIAVIGAFLDATGSIIDKRIINKTKINFKNYIVYVFLSIILVSIPLLFFFWEVDKAALEPINIIIFISIVIISIFAGFFMFSALKKEDLSEVLPIKMTLPLFSIILAFVFSFFFDVYSNERNYSILFLSLIASMALILAHVKKNKIVFNKYSIYALIGSFLFAVELVISKPILQYYHPITFYFIRSLWIFIIVWVLYHPKLSSLENNTRWMILLVAISAVLARFILYYGFENLGIIFTTTIFILAPVLTYFFAWIFLKEKITFKEIISSIVIVVCVIIAFWIRS